MRNRKKKLIVQVLSCSVFLIAAVAVLKWQSMRQKHVVEVEVSNLGGTYTLHAASLARDTGTFPSSFRVMISNPITEVDLSVNSWPRQEAIAPIPPVHDNDLKVVSSLKHLSRLSVRGMPVTDTSVDQLARFQNLKQLDIRETRISKHGLSRLKAALPSCDVVAELAD